MKKLLRRIRGALGMGLTWAAAWAFVGGLIELVLNILPGPDGALVDIWIIELAIPGFFAGMVFSGVLRVAAGRRRFDELSIPGFALLGAVGGLLIGTLGVVVGLGGSAFPDLWVRAAVLVGPTTLLSAICASGTLALARMGEDRELLDASEDVAEVGLSERDTRELLGGGS
jgi:hypothetical protein